MDMNLKLTTLMLLTFGCMNNYEAQAGYVRVINENPKKITIRVIPEPALNSREAFRKVIKGTSDPRSKNYTDFHIHKGHVDNKSHFAIAGETKFFLGDKCRNLSILKNYEVSFQDDALGTSCIAEEVPESLFKS